MRLPYVVVALGAGMLALPGGAAVLFDLPTASGPLLSPGSVTVDFTGRAGAGRADFRIRGYASLDGADNGYTDVFTLSHNGVALYSGAFNLGGGGGDVQYFAPADSRFAASTPGMWQGGVVDLSVPIALAAGWNTLSFRYSGNAQGGWDEAWGLDSLKVTGGAAGAVPEPASWVMLITGFGFVGAALRSRRKARPVVSA